MADEEERASGSAEYTLSAGDTGAAFQLHADDRAASQWTLEPSAAPSAARETRPFTMIDAAAEPANSRYAPPWSRPAESHTAPTPAEHGSPTAEAAPRASAEAQHTGLPPRTASPPPPASRVSPDLLALFRGPAGVARATAVRRDLTAAVDRWWRSEELPTDALLQDGLLLLEAGLPLDETQRTLLARTAIARRRGMITAIRHLRDPERTAGLLHEALQRRLLAPDDLRRLLHEEPSSRDWAPLLATEVRADLASPLPAIADRAETLLQVLATDAPRAAASGAAPARPATVTVDDLPERRGRWRLFAAAILIVALIALVVAARLAATPAATIRVAAGDYPVSVADGSRVLVALEAFDIDRTEVTRGAWGGCVERGGCAPLPDTLPDALPDTPPASDKLPVAGVTQAEATAYCATLGKRLPTAAEWEVAASWAPRTQRAWRWPWGDVFEPAYVIGAGAEGSAAVGSRSPQGDSPLGAADMAGNVAEWTATLAGDPPGVQVRGGSWRSGADALRTNAVELLPADSRLPTLGFRCATSPSE